MEEEKTESGQAAAGGVSTVGVRVGVRICTGSNGQGSSLMRLVVPTGRTVPRSQFTRSRSGEEGIYNGFDIIRLGHAPGGLASR